MARLDCYKKPDVERLTHEWERDKDAAGEWTFTPSSKIDPTRTHLNYRMEPNHGRAIDALKHRQADPGLRVDKRKHVNAVGVWVVTCPQELVGDAAKERVFFDEAYRTAKERYGAANVLQGYVHMDETTPHMHIVIVPVDAGRVSAKAVFDRTELREFQRTLDREMELTFGQKGLILNGRTKGNYTVNELRERTKDATERESKKRSLYGREVRVKKREDAVKEREDAVKAAEARLKADKEALELRRATLTVEEIKSRRLIQEAQEEAQKAKEKAEADAKRAVLTWRKCQSVARTLDECSVLVNGSIVKGRDFAERTARVAGIKTPIIDRSRDPERSLG